MSRNALSPSEVRQVEWICDRFEAAWRAGERPLLEAYLDQAVESLQSRLLRELLPLDWEYRLRAGDPPRDSEYERRFPAAGGWIEATGREVATATAGDRVLSPRFGSYRIIRHVGSGGMGVVYEAVHEPLGRRVALKVLRGINLTDATARERFRREAQTTARLQHANIVQIFEVGEHEGLPFLALEFVAGPSLGDRLRQAPLPPQQAAALVESLARAVHHAHEQGIVHRDLKPANVLLAIPRGESESGDGVSGEPSVADRLGGRWSVADCIPKVTDFGLAHPAGECDLTATGDIVGTPAYMAPELAWGKSRRQRVAPPADVYSLGAVLYESMTGRPPFQAATPLEALELVRCREPVPPSRIQPQVPRDLETICLKCLEKEPSRRYTTAEALAADLRRFQEREPISARRAGPAERLRRWCRRNPALAVASLLGVAALASATGLAVNQAFTVQLRREQKLTQTALQDARFQRTRAESNAAQLARQQELTRAALVEAEQYRRQAERLSAGLALERGLVLLEQGDIGRAMLLLGHSLQIASAGDTDHQHVIRSNLAAAFHQLPFHLHAILEHAGDEHAGDVRTVAFSPDGGMLVTGGSRVAPQRWDAASGEPIGDPLPHEGDIAAAGYSPDGLLLVTAGSDKTARLWTVATGQPAGQPLRHLHAVQAVAFSPDGATLLTGSAGGTARFWDIATGEPRGEYVSPGRIQAVAFSPDGRSVLTGSADHTARLWDATDGLPCGPVFRHANEVYAVAFSPDGRTVLTASKDGTVRRWDAATGEPRGVPLQHPGWVHAVAVSPDGATILTGCEDATARLWDAKTGLPVGEPLPHRGPVRAVAVSPDGSKLLTGTWDDRTSRLWDAVTLQPLGPPLPHPAHVMAVAFSPDGRTVATGDWDGTARLWDVATHKPLGPPLVHAFTVRDVAFSPDGRTLWTASFDRSVRSWELPGFVAGDVSQIELWIQVLTGMELDPDRLFRELDAATWRERRQQLKQRGDPPLTFSLPVRGKSAPDLPTSG